MRSKKKEDKTEKCKLHVLPAKPVHTAFIFFTLIAIMVFFGAVTAVNAFPAKYAGILMLVVLAIFVVQVILLNSRKTKTKKRIIGVVISVIMILLLSIGSFYMISTASMFSKITKESGMTEDFHVIVLEEGSYSEPSDIKGNKVYVSSGESKTYKEAKGKLMSKYDVTYEEVDDFITLGQTLVDDKGKTHDEIVFMSNTNYEMACEEISDLDKNTKILDTVSIKIDSNKNSAKRVDVAKEPFNVYISGIDTFGSIDRVARSDVNMVMTVNPNTKNILLTSIPRDMYVTLHSYGAKDKLTHSGIYGVDETVATVEDWLGFDINYYIRVNFTTLVDIVDVIGGIDVESEYAFKSSVSDNSYVAGTNHLDGEEALYFARERKSLSGGDNERVMNQQRVLKGIITKITTSPVILTKYTQLLGAVGDKMQTSLTENDIGALVRAQIDDLGGWTIESTAVKGKGSMGPTYSMGSRNLYIMIPNDDSVAEVQKQINKVMYPAE